MNHSTSSPATARLAEAVLRKDDFRIRGQLLVAAFFSVSALSPATAASTCPFDAGGLDVLNDGVVLTRYALGITGAPMIASTRYASLDPLQVKNNIECVGCALDMNGDGVIDTVDTTIIARRLAGFQGASLTAGLALGSGSRPDLAAVTSFLASGCAVGGAINAFVQGGNAFGAAATVGTTDAFPLTVKSGGTAVSVLTARGDGLRIAERLAFGAFSPNTINGNQSNSVSGSITNGATIAGGGESRNDGEAQFPNVVTRSFGTISGGLGNTVSGFYATVPGGLGDTASGESSFAAGLRAQATHKGAFVWGDSQSSDYGSVATNSFNIRAGGGVHLDPTTRLNFGATTRQMINLWGSTVGADGLFGIGVQTNATYFRTGTDFCWFRGGAHDDGQCAPGAGGTLRMQLSSTGLTVNGTFASASDRNLKENIQRISAKDMLAKVIALPMNVWNYKEDSGKVKHIGPMAQDFKRLFNVGPGRQNDFHHRRQRRR